MLRIAAVTSAFTEVLSRALRAFQDQCPGVELRLSEIDTPSAVLCVNAAGSDAPTSAAGAAARPWSRFAWR